MVAAARQGEEAIEDPIVRLRLDLTEMVRFCGRVYCDESSNHALAVNAIRARHAIGMVESSDLDTEFDRLRVASLGSVAGDIEGLDADAVDLVNADRIAAGLTRFFQQRKVSQRPMVGVFLICLNEAYAVAGRYRDPYLGARNIAEMRLFTDPEDEQFVALCDELTTRFEDSTGRDPEVVTRIEAAMAEFTRAHPV
ncbi:hypothetical protein [Nocardia barduliensis]|uniref:hypothetical protein n=1 Tax=Nocardia barduliensis TaxID=2736643 RepID=UPI0015736EEB|nr:hypothetical protein [Nocardia barduliensis]